MVMPLSMYYSKIVMDYFRKGVCQMINLDYEKDSKVIIQKTDFLPEGDEARKNFLNTYIGMLLFN